MDILWQDRKRILGMPISFTKYTLTPRLVTQQKGLFTTVHDQVQLFRITDVRVTRTLWQKPFGCGTLILFSSDQSHPQFHIHWIKDPLKIKDMIMDQVALERRRNRVISNDMLLQGAEGREECPEPDGDVDAAGEGE